MLSHLTVVLMSTLKAPLRQVECALSAAFETMCRRIVKFQATAPADWQRLGRERTLSGRREAVSEER